PPQTMLESSHVAPPLTKGPFTPRTMAPRPTFNSLAFTSKTLAPFPRPTNAPDTDVLFANLTRRPSCRRPPTALALSPPAELELLFMRAPSTTLISQLGTCVWPLAVRATTRSAAETRTATGPFARNLRNLSMVLPQTPERIVHQPVTRRACFR